MNRLHWMRAHRRPGSRTRTIVLTALAVSTLDYFCDADRGHHRRAIARDQARATARQLTRRVTHLIRFEEGRARGVLQARLHLRRADNPHPDDLTLRDRVTSELFGDPKVPKGDLNIDVVNRVVELRGQVASTEAVAAIIAKVRAIPYVNDVHSYLHLPGTPAPNKAEVLADF